MIRQKDKHTADNQLLHVTITSGISQFMLYTQTRVKQDGIVTLTVSNCKITCSVCQDQGDEVLSPQDFKSETMETVGAAGDKKT